MRDATSQVLLGPSVTGVSLVGRRSWGVAHALLSALGTLSCREQHLATRSPQSRLSSVETQNAGGEVVRWGACWEELRAVETVRCGEAVPIAAEAPLPSLLPGSPCAPKDAQHWHPRAMRGLPWPCVRHRVCAQPSPSVLSAGGPQSHKQTGRPDCCRFLSLTSYPQVFRAILTGVTHSQSRRGSSQSPGGRQAFFLFGSKARTATSPGPERRLRKHVDRTGRGPGLAQWAFFFPPAVH